MNFSKLFVLVVLLLALSMGQSEAGFLKKIGKKIERAGRRVRDGTVKGLAVAQQAANVAATVQQG
uniref:Uncharacterized protein n=1 Tax=Glossina austeni TaxID=7395 RepID=A0A1A9VPX2_GLOAU